MASFPGRALCNFPWRTIDAALESRIAQPPVSSVRNLQSFLRSGQVTDQFTGVHVAHHRAAGNCYVKVLARPTRSCCALHPGCPLSARNFRATLKSTRVLIDGSATRYTLPPCPPVTTIRTTPLHEFLAPKTQAAVAAVAGLDPNCCFVDKLSLLYSRECIRRAANRHFRATMPL